MKRSISGRTYALFAAIAVALSLTVIVGCFALAEAYLHGRYGVNLWGYRGPSLGRKAPSETRIAVVGGSTAWGYGVPWHQAFPALLERRLTASRRREGLGPVTVANLAFNNEAAHSFAYTLRDYEYLNYDAVLFYTGYNDLGRPNLAVFRHESPLFRSTGIVLLVPNTFREWAAALRHGRLGERTVFDGPDAARLAAATALEKAGRVVSALERQLGPLSANQPSAVVPAATDCSERWGHYCAKLRMAIEYALRGGRRVFVVTQPYIADSHVEQQRFMTAMLRGRFGGNEGVIHIDLGRTVDLRDRSLTFDGMHLTAGGHEVIADRLAHAVHRRLSEDPATLAK